MSISKVVETEAPTDLLSAASFFLRVIWIYIGETEMKKQTTYYMQMCVMNFIATLEQVIWINERCGNA